MIQVLDAIFSLYRQSPPLPHPQPPSEQILLEWVENGLLEATMHARIDQWGVTLRLCYNRMCRSAHLCYLFYSYQGLERSLD